MADYKEAKLSYFDVHSDPSTVGIRWKKWLRDFELYAEEKDIVIPSRKKAALLRRAGHDVQDIFYGELEPAIPIPAGGGQAEADAVPVPNVYTQVIQILNAKFIPQQNVIFERHVFRGLTPKVSDSADDFVLRLREQAQFCDFQALESDMIRDQYIEKCPWRQLKEDLLKVGNGLTLQETCSMARIHERAKSQAGTMTEEKSQLNRIKFDKNKPKENHTQKRSVKCYRCGNLGHINSDKQCPAWGKTCDKCGIKDHLAEVCRTLKPSGNKKGQKSTRKEIKQIIFEPEESQSNNDDYAFTIVCRMDEKSSDMVPVLLGGVKLNMLVDSGAACNVISKKVWQNLKNEKIKAKSYIVDKNLVPYGHKEPLKVLGVFECITECNDKSINAEFVVFDGEGISLLGTETAKALGVLKIGLNINAMEESSIFQGVGKLKNFQLCIPVDEKVKPIAQGIRRCPYNLKPVLEEELKSLQSYDVIESVTGPTTWVSPAHLVPRKNNRWRLCVDMRQANEAVIRERFPIPHVEELLHDLNGSTVFSKLDFNLAFHQVELAEESREITTFSTHLGLFRYKRLFFGLKCAPEMFCRIMSQVFQGCEGVCIFFDDVVVHGCNKEQHDERLAKVLKVIENSGMTLNKEKSTFGLQEITFLGHHISSKGISPSQSNQNAILEFREPKDVTELKSFLGLVNFSARFVNNFSTLVEPLRKLTRKGVSFKWKEEQQSAFKSLKDCIAKQPVLGFYDRDAPSTLVADASPVGLGAVLVQDQNDGPRIVRYASRALTDVERRYSHSEKESLALVWACETLHMYLTGKKFTLVTDHKALESIFKPTSKPCARIERWVMRLQAFDFQVVYQPGKTNIADSLSRLLDLKKRPTSSQEDTESYVRRILEVSVPIAMTLSEIVKASATDSTIQELIQCLSTNKWTKELKKYELIQQELSVVDDMVLRGTRIILPKSLQARALELAHEGHLGIVAMKQRLRTKLFWTGMDKDVEKWGKSCHGCQLEGIPDPPEPMVRTQLPQHPWEYISIDFLGPLPSKDYLLLIVDYYSRFYEVFITKSITGEVLISKLKIVFAKYGLPLALLADNGGAMIDENLKTFLSQNGVQFYHSTPLWPQANGEVERQNRSLLKRMRIAQAQKQNWKEELLTYLAAYSTTPHTTTGVPPGELMFGRKIRSKIPSIMARRSLDDEEIRDRDTFLKEKGREYADIKRRAKPSAIIPGEKVLLQQERKNKLFTRYQPVPYKVLEKNGNSVIIQHPEGHTYSRNTHHVKPYVEPDKVTITEDSQDAEIVIQESPETETAPETQQSRSPHRESVAPSPRKQRERRPPKWMKDFVVDN